jgi:ABC-2 type transport system ATP-binding protein
MTDNFAIEIKDLTKRYGKTTVVDCLNFHVRENEVFGLLGPNGAGKTTTILMMLGLTEPVSGTVQVCGYDPTREPLKVKRITGYLPESVGFYNNLTARENLEFIADLNNISRADARERIDRVLETVGLTAEKNVQTGKFSKGMKQRLGIADVLIKEPKLIILDEPTSGLDPQGINQLLDVIAALPATGTTVLLSSHQLYQVQRVCNSIGILSKGKIVIEGRIDELSREAMAGGRFIIEVEIAELQAGLADIIRHIPGVDKVEAAGKVFKINTSTDLRSQISRAVMDSGALLVQMKFHEFSLDDIYMKYFEKEQGRHNVSDNA